MKSASLRKNYYLLVFTFILGTIKCQLECPPQERILPCKCLLRGEEFQIWCTHSELHRVLDALKSLAQYVNYPIDELILENNNIPSLPGRTFAPLQIMRLMLRNNGLERVSSDWLVGLETSLLELYIVEPVLRSFPEDSLHHIIALEAVTIQTELLKRVPEFSGLSRLKHLHIESTSLIDLSSKNFKSLPLLEKFYISGSPRLTRLESGLLQDLPRLNIINISKCGITYLHPRSFTHLPVMNELILTGNKIADAGIVGRAVRDLPSLTSLKLDHNNIDKLESASFVDLPVLKHLSLTHNRITEIYHGAFHKVPSLKTLDLSSNLIRRIHPESFLQYSGSGVEELWINDNDINNVFELRSLLEALPRLIYLDMSYNFIQKIPYGALRGHPTLEQLHLNHNKIHLIEREAFTAMPSLRELRLRNNSLTNLLNAPFWNLPVLKGLDLSQNYYRRIEPRFLANIPSLRRIDLSENLINIIDPASFLNTPALEHVNLSYNTLTALHSATFRHLINLYELDISANGLTEFVPGLPRGIENLFMKKNKILNLPTLSSPDIDLPALRSLDISSNGLQRIVYGGLRTLSQLKKLYLRNNNLQHLEEGSFDGLTKLEKLDLGENRLMVIHQNSLKGVVELQELNLQSNLLELIRPELLQNTKRLKKIDISHNHLSEIITGTLDFTRELQVINASFNNLADFSYSFRGLKDLKILDLTNNRIRDIKPDVLGTLSSLKELRISKNVIRELHKGSFSNLPNLNALYIDNNKIKLIDSYAINDLPKLSLVKIDKNQLEEIPDSAFSELPSLEVIELQENRLKLISANAFYHVPQLLFLNLSHNQLTGLENAGLKSLRSLEILDISENKLTRVATSELEKMEWLVELKMNNNEICGIHGTALNDLLRLRILSLKNNKIVNIPEVAVKKMRSNIAILDVDGNPLHCSCSMLWLRTWLQETGSLGPHCSDGTLLREIRLSRQECMIEQKTPESVAPGCEPTLLTGLSYSTSQVFSQWMDIKEQTTQSAKLVSMAPSPEESDYFYEEYIDYPYNESNSIDQNNNLSNSNQNIKTSTSTVDQKSSHFISGDTPTIYAAPNNNKQKQQDISKDSSNPSPSSSGFTFFGVPLPSLNINKLWSGSKKKVERKNDLVRDRNGSGRGNMFLPTDPEVQTGGFVPILPGSGGFKPMLNPPNIIQTDILKPNEINSTPISTDVTQDFLLKRGSTSKIELLSTNTPSVLTITASSNLVTYNSLPTTSEGITEKYIANMVNRNEESTLMPTEINIINTSDDVKKTTGNDFQSKAKLQINENDSLGNSFQEVIESISVSQVTTIVPEEEITDLNVEIYKIHNEPSTISLISTKKYINNNSENTNIGLNGEKGNLTSLSVLLIPGGQVPPYRPSGRSTITKVSSPHVTSTSSLFQHLNNVTEQLPATTKQRNIFSTVDNAGTSQIPPHDRSVSWYFINYNKTNLQPYVDPAITAYTENLSSKIYSSTITILFISSFIYLT